MEKERLLERGTHVTIHLKPEQQRIIALAVRSGACQNPGEVLDQAFSISAVPPIPGARGRYGCSLAHASHRVQQPLKLLRHTRCLHPAKPMQGQPEHVSHLWLDTGDASATDAKMSPEGADQHSPGQRPGSGNPSFF